MTQSQFANDPRAAIDALLARRLRLFRLDDALEAEFERETAPARNQHLIFFLMLGVAAILLCLPLDAVMGARQLQLGLLGRVGLAMPLHLIAILVMRCHAPVRWQGIAAVAAMLSTVGVGAALGAAVGGEYLSRYNMAAGMLAVAVNLIVPLRLPHAVAFSILAVMLMIAVLFGFSPPTDAWQNADLVGFLAAMTLLTLIVAVRREATNRRAFLFGRRECLMAQQLRTANDQLLQLSNTDPLTGLANRRYFDLAYQRAWRAAIDSGACLSVMMIDIDHFKAFNDSLGHAEGDHCLRTVAGMLADHVSDTQGVVARYGGEEFVVLLPETPQEDACPVGERLRCSVEDLRLLNVGISRPVTISVGVAATRPIMDGDPVDLIRQADTALYRAKLAGRNQVAVAPEERPAPPETSLRQASI